MGHLINPISTRLGFSSFWLSTWTGFSLKEFSYNLMLDYGLASLMEWIFIHSWFSELLTRNGIFLSHYRILRRGKKIRFHAFLIYNSSIFLKSSFVEPHNQTSSTDWLALWTKHHFTSKFQNKVRDSLIATGQSNLNLHFSNELKALVKHQWQDSKKISPARGSGSNNSRLKKPPKTSNRLNYKLRVRKLHLARLLELSNLFFSKLVSSIASHFLSKVGTFKNTQLSIGLRFLSTFNLINPQFLARFIARRISYGFPLNRVIRPIMKDLTRLMGSKKCKIIGFRIACSGRFDRKQIASYVWHKHGPVSLNQFDANINYGYATAFLKYGTCGIKVWIASKHHVLKSQFAVRHSSVINGINHNVLFFGNYNKDLTLFVLLRSFALLDEFFKWLNKNKTFLLFNHRVPFYADLDKWKKEQVGQVVLSKRLQLLVTQWVRYENLMLVSK